MKLMAKRFWLCSEVPKGMVLDDALVKQITGGDIVSSRQLYGNQIEFMPVGKLWFLVNDMPRVRYDDKGMWRRIVPIPFNANFTGNNGVQRNQVGTQLRAHTANFARFFSTNDTNNSSRRLVLLRRLTTSMFCAAS